MIKGETTAERRPSVSVNLRGMKNKVITVTAYLDTGFDGTISLPDSMVKELELDYYGSHEFTLANNEEVSFSVHAVIIEWVDGEQGIVAYSAEGPIMIGMGLLYGYHISIDAIDGGAVIIRQRE